MNEAGTLEKGRTAYVSADWSKYLRDLSSQYRASMDAEENLYRHMSLHEKASKFEKTADFMDAVLERGLLAWEHKPGIFAVERKRGGFWLYSPKTGKWRNSKGRGDKWYLSKAPRDWLDRYVLVDDRNKGGNR